MLGGCISASEGSLSFYLFLLSFSETLVCLAKLAPQEMVNVKPRICVVTVLEKEGFADVIKLKIQT